EGVRGTDLGKVLATLASRQDLSAYQAVVLLTDGGDEPVQAARLPSVPLYIAGIGTDPSTWNDLALANVEAPSAVEERTSFKIEADIIARRADSQFATGLRSVPVTLEEQIGNTRQVLGKETVDLTGGGRHVSFRVEPRKDAAERKLRLSVAGV